MSLPTSSALQASLLSLGVAERRLLDKYLGAIPAKWLPQAGPQLDAYLSEADQLFYGGAGGGGKTDLEIGLGLEEHQKTIIFRREFPQLAGIADRLVEILGNRNGFNSQTGMWRLGDGRTIELASVPHADDVEKYRGRPHDLICFDEGTQFTEDQYRFLIGWCRSTKPGQRCRVVLAGNPPTDAEGEWVIRYWAPWLDPEHLNPAAPGELRWFAVLDGVDTEVAGPEPFEFTGKDGETETIEPTSRTFIPARVEDNDFLMRTGYKRQLQSLPEPLRTQVLKGLFGARKDDNKWQVIPSAWVDAAMVRWAETPRPDVPITALGVDVARGGKDKTVIAPRRGLNYFDEFKKIPGSETPDGPTAAAFVLTARDGHGAVNLDIIGVGGSAYDCLNGTEGITVNAMNGAGASKARDRSGQLGMVNKRAEWYWAMREALDPENGINLALPPDRELKADLCAPRWKLTPRGIQIESKEDIIKRLGRSPDCGDAAVYGLAEADQGGDWFVA